ncbi:MAG: MFS transporter TsgA [Gammaproteobacteria bacterium]|nr:MFS transporter TsgA [Gammaproteobacteria bacterium]MCY4337587.1 MFS transporter TsgA [Gammaproteobacteria bacterium]
MSINIRGQNKLRITLTSFLAYFTMSAVISPLGIISGPIAAHYNIPVTTATAGFSYLTAGILVGTLVSLLIFDWFRLKHIVLCCSALTCAALACIYLVDSYLLFPLWLFLAGLACGVNLTASIIVITNIYNARLRASMMLLTDSFYSMAGALSTWLAAKFILHQFHWGSAYLLAFLVAVVIICVACFSSFPSISRREVPRADNSAGKRWPAEIFLVGAAILIYLTGFVTIYSWIPNFTQARFDLDADMAGGLVSRFFLGMFIGQLVMFWLALKCAPTRIIFVAAILATLLSFSLWNVDSAFHLTVCMFVLGLVTGGLLKLVIAFGTMLMSAPTPRMISFLIFNSALGTALAPALSAVIVERYDMVAALQFTSICYCLMIALLCGACLRTSKNALRGIFSDGNEKV